MTVSLTFTIIDYLAVAVFAITGALAGARKGMDLVGLVWLAAVTGIGGGTMRDLLLAQQVFWVAEPAYLYIATAAAVLVFLTPRTPKASDAALLWLDAAGLAFVSVVGAGKALASGAPASVAVLMGVITASLGGILRDVLVQEPSILMRREIYITAAVLGAAVFVAAHAAGVGNAGAALAGVAAGFALRAGAIVRGWRLPGARMGGEGPQR